MNGSSVSHDGEDVIQNDVPQKMMQDMYEHYGGSLQFDRSI